MNEPDRSLGGVEDGPEEPQPGLPDGPDGDSGERQTRRQLMAEILADDEEGVSE